MAVWSSRLEIPSYRYSANGSSDGTFTFHYFIDAAQDNWSFGTASTLSLLPDGRIFVGGNFTDVDVAGSDHFGVAVLDANGNIDAGFRTSHQPPSSWRATSFRRMSDGSVLTSFGYSLGFLMPAVPYNFARLQLDGTLVQGAVLSTTDLGSILNQGFRAREFVELADGRLFTFGYGSAAFFANGAEDEGFRLNTLIDPIKGRMPASLW